jgi:TPR repeat protein
LFVIPQRSGGICFCSLRKGLYNCWKYFDRLSNRDEVRALWKIAACIVLIAASVVAWQIHKTKAQQRKLSDAAKAVLLRAQQGDPQAQYDLGHMYFHGDGASQNYTEALRWYRKSAEQNNAKAQSVLGYIYFYGQGATHDYAEALRCYRLAAAQGEVSAEDGIAYLYRYGYGVPQDYTEALRWYHLSADQGDAIAEDGIAFSYLHGQGVTQSDAEALRWFHLAAEQGNAPAEEELGSMYYHGRGTPQDYSQAFSWYQKAATQGDAQAQYDVSYMYRYGKGVPQNFAEANRWVSKSADQGNKYALIVASHNLMGLTEITLLIELLAGLLFTFSFLPANFLESGKSLRDPRQQLFTATGVLILSTVGLNWYGYTHYKLRKIGYGTNTFTIFHWLLEAVVIALLLYTVNFGNKPSIGQDEDDSVPLS